MEKVIIIGAGHNGLVTAFYLAKAGYNVQMFESRKVPGGLCVTEELMPNYNLGTLASWCGMLREEIVEDTGIKLKTHLPRMSELAIFGDGSYYLPHDDPKTALTQNNLETKFKELGSENPLMKMYEDLDKASKILYPLLLESPISKKEVENLLMENGLTEVAENIFSTSWFDFVQDKLSALQIDKDFKDKILALHCSYSFGSPFAKGSIYGVIYAFTAKTNGEYGRWGFIEGGMGEITKSLSQVVESLGVKIHLESPVGKILIEDEKAVGIMLKSGEKHYSDIVISNADPYNTLAKLAGLKEETKEKSEEMKHPYAAVKIHLALKELPELNIDIKDSIKDSLGSVVLIPNLSEIKESLTCVEQGKIPKNNVITFFFPSMYDPNAAPNEKHAITLDHHFVTSSVNGNPWSDEVKKVIYENTLNQLEILFPNMRESIEDYVIISPSDIEKEYGSHRGNPWHIDCSSDQLWDSRPISGTNDYQTPIKGLYLCGAGTHPGGTVTGANGHNCAKAILKKKQ